MSIESYRAGNIEMPAPNEFIERHAWFL
jgi:hypothetical protein